MAAITRITAAESVPAGLTMSGMAQPCPMPGHCKGSGGINEAASFTAEP